MKVINPEEVKGSAHANAGISGGISKDVVNKAMGATKVRVQLQVLHPGPTENRHTHEDAEQCQYVLKGELTVTTPQGSKVIRAGMFGWIPAGEEHQVHNSGKEDAHYLAITTPPPA